MQINVTNRPRHTYYIGLYGLCTQQNIILCMLKKVFFNDNDLYHVYGTWQDGIAKYEIQVFPVVFNSFVLFVQLTGITGLGGSFLLHKYRVYGLFFSNFSIIFPALLAVVSGIVLFITGTIGCLVSSKKPSCGHGLVRWRNMSFYSVKAALNYIVVLIMMDWDFKICMFLVFQFVYFLIIVFCVVGTTAALAYFYQGKVIGLLHYLAIRQLSVFH